MNIYHTILINGKPVFYPKGQKNDFFIGPKEFQLYNHLGYFGNDYFYLKLYNLIKISYDNYKVSIFIFYFLFKYCYFIARDIISIEREGA